MNRAIIGLAAVLASFTVLHSGKTDFYGGHYNHSTGEYHYHHGYSAHDHYDINGDGIVDCPYTFKDNTSNKSNTSNSDSKTNNIKKSSDNKKYRKMLETITATVLAVSIPTIIIIGRDKRSNRK